MSRRRLLWSLVAIAAGAFLLRLVITQRFQGLASGPDASSNPDQVDYELFGWRLADGAGYTLDSGVATARRPPGTSFALLLPYLLFGHSWFAARVWFCLLSAATCAVTGLIATEAFGALTGLIAAAALALDPAHFYYSQHFLSEVPYGLTITLTALFALRWLRAPSFKIAAAAGLLFGFALLTRPQVAFAAPLALLCLLASRRLRSTRRVAQLLLAGAVAAAMVVPWLVRNEVAVGRATISTIGGFTFWGANNAVIVSQPRNIGGWMPVDTLIDANHRLDGSEVENDRAAWRYGMEYVRDHLSGLPKLLLMKAVRHLSPFRPTPNRVVYWSFVLAWLTTAPLLLLGCVREWSRRRAELTILLLPCLSTLLTALIFYGSIRFRDADVALFIAPAAAAVAAFAPREWREGFAANGARARN
jgi:4-amino-4-deoxy-L-arabinose transferase-like glycosyltransferase